MKLVFATNNSHKIEEVKSILSGCREIEILSLSDIGCHEDIPEDHDTFAGNALQKAHFVHERFGLDCFADDTGLEVNALEGEPGVKTARYAGDNHDSNANMEKLLGKLNGIMDRSARFRTVIALILNGKEYLFEGIVNGTIALNKSGTAGFGYDPVFIPEGYNRTFSDLDMIIKNTISHRAKAIAELKNFLINKYA